MILPHTIFWQHGTCFSSTSSTHISKVPAYSRLRVICQGNLELQALNLNRAVVVDPRALLERISSSSNFTPRLLLFLFLLLLLLLLFLLLFLYLKTALYSCPSILPKPAAVLLSNATTQRKLPDSSPKFPINIWPSQTLTLPSHSSICNSLKRWNLGILQASVGPIWIHDSNQQMASLCKFHPSSSLYRFAPCIYCHIVWLPHAILQELWQPRQLYILLI